eukprot:jgi/Ulvmu1/11025/UM007_0205.1
MLLNVRSLCDRKQRVLGHRRLVGDLSRSQSKLQAARRPHYAYVPGMALIGAVLISITSPAAALVGPGAVISKEEMTVPSAGAGIIKDGLTMRDAASTVMPPAASLEALPKASATATQPQQQAQGPEQSKDSPTPGEPSTPPPSKRRLSRLQELQQARDDLRAKQQELLQKTEELQEKEQTIAILKEELDVERVLRALLENDKDKAEEMAKLATGLCSGAMLPP